MPGKASQCKGCKYKGTSDLSMSYSFLAETQLEQFVNFPKKYFSNWSKICRHCTVNSVLQVRIDEFELLCM